MSTVALSGARAEAPAAVGARARELLQVLGIAAQLALALLVVRQFRIDSRTFYYVALLAAAGFVVHAVLPLRLRLPFFLALSLASVGIAFGVRGGALLVATGAVLIGICHLPVRFGLRVVLLLVAGAALAAARVDWIPGPWPPDMWAILGSMFMFRLALYLHALRSDDAPRTPARTLAYFFMLPNVCFPLFPVVDYSTFARNYYDADPYTIYQTGMRWIARGLVHLVAYRFVYLHLTGDPADVADLGGLVRFVLATFLLYLRVSGQFHLIVGMLHLFGFRLPETHHLYYLSSGFTDFWRRINIYWKDFMMKLVYYPSFFRLRRWGGTTALVGATMLVFVATWLLHSYQWFWLRGDFPLTVQDALFWGILAALVVVTAVREARPGRSRARVNRARGRSSWSASLAVRTVGTFSAICILWSLWSAESLDEWLGMWAAAGHAGVADLLAVAALLIGGLAVAGRAWGARTLRADRDVPAHRHPGVLTAATLAGLLLLGAPAVRPLLGPRAGEVVASLQRPTLNARDAALQHKGYYEKLGNVSAVSTQLWEVYAKKPADWDPGLSGVIRRRRDFLRLDLRPSTAVTSLGQPLHVNRWGMRDRDYELAKPAGTFRIAVLGPSHVMGWGVADGEPFEAVLEARLNRELRGSPYGAYEVLNFGVASYSVLQQMTTLEERALAFRPDVVIVTTDPYARSVLADHLLGVLDNRIPIPYPDLEALLRRAGVAPGDTAGIPLPFAWLRADARAMGVAARQPWRETKRQLSASSGDVAEWSLARMAAVSRANGAVPVLLVLASVGGVLTKEDATRTLRVARRAGYLVLDLSDVYRGYDVDALRFAEWDSHPNALAHRLIADRLFAELQRHRAALGLDTAASP